MGHYQFVKDENGRLQGKANYPRRMVGNWPDNATGEKAALMLEEAIGAAANYEMGAIWIQWDKSEEVLKKFEEIKRELIG